MSIPAVTDPGQSIAPVDNNRQTKIAVGNSGENTDYEELIASYPYDYNATNYVTSVAVSANYVATTLPVIIMCDCSLAGLSITLPNSGDMEGRTVIVQKMDSSANAVTMVANGTDTFYVQSTVTARLSSQYGAVSYTAVSNASYKGWVGR